MRATGQKEVVQVVWLYEHPINLDGLRRFHHNLGHGLLGRRIERSPLPFGRHRWVLDPEPPALDIAECARPRAEFSDWIDERSQLLTDAEWGPGWHLGVVPFTDGSTGITLVASHYLVDGLGLGVTIAEALLGVPRDFGYPPPRSCSRLRAAARDAQHTVRDAPEVGRAIAAAAKLARSRPKATAQSPAPRPVAPIEATATTLSSFRRSRSSSTRMSGMPVRRLLVERPTRWSQGLPQNSGSIWDVGVPATAPSPCNSLSATARRVIRVRSR